MDVPADALRRIRECVSRCIGHDLEKVHAESYLVDDLGCDSLDKVEITLEVEEAFQVEIPDDVAEKVITVGDILKAIEQGTPRRAPGAAPTAQRPADPQALAQRDQFARWIVARAEEIEERAKPFPVIHDHACAQCNGTIPKEGFVCTVHEARAVLAKAGAA